MGNAIDPSWFREVLAQYPTGVCVVTATEPDGRRAGFVVGSFTSVSLDPPLVGFFPDKNSSSWPRIRNAGKFCVNILSAEQEDVCRRFAARAEDKFAGLDFRDADSGSPIITGVAAWIDCDIESVGEAGDHYAVLGRVRRLGVEKTSLPLLFFGGGYGRFSPLSLAAGNPRGALTEQLRHVDLVRKEMEQVTADIPGSRCSALTLVDDELVVTASAAGVDVTAPATLVGLRLTFMPPLGMVFAAWMEGADQERWLAHVPTDEARTRQKHRLAVVRERGFSVVLHTERHRQFQSMLAEVADSSGAVDTEELHDRLLELANEQVELSPAMKSSLGSITVPIFDRDGNVAIALTVYGFREPMTADQADAYIDRLILAGQRASALLAAH